MASTTSTLGDIGQIALPASAVLVTLFNQDKQGLGQLAATYGATLGTVYILKPTVDRERPDGGSGSFPSGHTASAFAGAGYLQIRYGWAYGVPAYLAASFVGYSRVEADRHWTSDVVAGAAIGIIANLIFTKPYQNTTMTAYANNESRGIAIETRW